MTEIEKTIADGLIEKIKQTEITKDFKLLICPVGLVGAGKSTTVVPLSRILKIPRVSSDEIRRELKNANLDYSALKDISNTICGYFLDLGFGLTLDQDLASQLEFVKTIKDKYHLQTIFLHINPPEEFIIRKLRNWKGDKWLTDDQEKMVENYFARKEAHKDIQDKIKFDYVVDTSLLNLEERIQEIGLDITKRFGN